MEIQGRIKLIDETKTYGTNGFRKRELVVTTEEQYPQHILVEFVQDSSDITTGEAYAYAAALGLSQAIATLFFIYSEAMAYSVALKIRSMLTSAIFDHVLTLDNQAKQQTSQGQVITMVSTDAQVSIEFM